MWGHTCHSPGMGHQENSSQESILFYRVDSGIQTQNVRLDSIYPLSHLIGFHDGLRKRKVIVQVRHSGVAETVAMSGRARFWEGGSG